MSLHRPRRIFRPALTPAGHRGLGFVLLAAAISAASVALAMAPWHVPDSPQSHAAAAATDLLAAPPAQVAVVDAATLRLQDHVVRLLGT